jgi:HAD superfamily phosphatase
MDGVLVDVTESYRESIVVTVEHFTGKQIDRDAIQDYKNAGGWNNDWLLSQKICADHGVAVPYDQVIREFNRVFLGNNGDGLINRERWIVQPGLLERLARDYHLSIFTGRDRFEARITLDRFALDVRFDPIVCADDVRRPKPDPEGLTAILECTKASELWYIGDTVDDARSAAAAGVRFIGISATGKPREKELSELLAKEGAVAVLPDVNQIEGVLVA